MANNRFFKEGNDINHREITSEKLFGPYFYRYLSKVKATMKALVKMKSMDYQNQYQLIENTMNMELFKKFSKQLSFLLGPSKTLTNRIASRYDDLSLFYHEIQKIREMNTREEIGQYTYSVLNSHYADSSSPFTPILIIEAHIKQEQLLCLHSEKSINQQNTIDRENNDDLLININNLSLTENEKNNNFSFSTKLESIFIERYKEYLKIFFAAHMQCLPRAFEPNKDNIEGIHHSRDFGPNNMA